MEEIPVVKRTPDVVTCILLLPFKADNPYGNDSNPWAFGNSR